MKILVKIDPRSIEHVGNFNIVIDDVPEQALVDIKALDELKPALLELLTDYVETDTNDYQELILTDVHYEILNSPQVEFIFKFQGTFKKHHSELGNYSLKDIIKVDPYKYSHNAKPLEEMLQAFLDEQHNYYYEPCDEFGIEKIFDLAVKGFYRDGILYAYEVEQIW